MLGHGYIKMKAPGVYGAFKLYRARVAGCSGETYNLAWSDIP